MKKTVIVLLGILFLFLGHDQAFSLPQGLGISADATSFDSEYGAYSQMLRLKVGNNLSKRLTVLEEGTVNLDLQISSEGKLIFLRVNNDKTKASQLMINNAIMAVKDSTPFDPFPKELARDNSKLSFNIYFSLKKK
jgi:hypothetical protein